MTEEKFEEMMERGGEKIETAVENAAQKLDDTLESTMKHRPARIIAKHFLMEALLALSLHQQN